jgi:hypothetical protein
MKALSIRSTVRVLQLQNLLQRIRQAGFGLEHHGPGAYRTALDAEVLLLDDLGRIGVDWVEDTITAIITHRCDQRSR